MRSAGHVISILRIVQFYILAKGHLVYNIYVDDILAGADSVQDLLTVLRDLVQLVQSGGFPLKKWKINCDELLKCIQIEYQIIEQTVTLTDDASLKILDVHWDPTIVVFGCQANIIYVQSQ